MKNKGIELDVAVYCALIDGYCHKGDMASVGLSPNTVIFYSSMISGFRNLQNMEAALDLHKRMMRGLLRCLLRVSIMPELITFSVLICSLYNKGQLENAHKVLEDMDTECMNPN
uniref:Pentatricopeptide repeat-containing protein n=1 Tax=Populus trichocarpa TaxID=3694 RepID=A0A2K1WV47_POPTR